MELVTSQMDSLQARRCCASSQDFRPVLPPSRAADDSRSRERFQVFLECHCPCLQLASSSLSPRARRCGQKEFSDQLALRTSYSVAKPACPQFHSWYAISAIYLKNATDAIIVKDRQHPFVGHSHWLRFATVLQNRSRHCLVDPDHCT